MSRLKEFILLNAALPAAEVISGTCASKWYRRICEMNRWSREAINEWQNKHLQAFIKHAYEHTQYYHHLFDALNIKPDDIKCAKDLKQIPVITKDIINAHYDELIPNDLHKMKYRISSSGGTTGIPMRYYCSEDVWGYVTAAKIYYWKKIV